MINAWEISLGTRLIHSYVIVLLLLHTSTLSVPSTAAEGQFNWFGARIRDVLSSFELDDTVCLESGACRGSARASRCDLVT